MGHGSYTGFKFNMVVPRVDGIGNGRTDMSGIKNCKAVTGELCGNAFVIDQVQFCFYSIA